MITFLKIHQTKLGILISIFIGLLFLRNDVEATVLRLPGQLFQHDNDKISNVYTYKIVNKTSKDYSKIHFELIDNKGKIKRVGNQEFKLIKQGISQGTLFIEIKEVHLNSDKTEVKIGVFDGKILLETTKTNFLAPRTFN